MDLKVQWDRLSSAFAQRPPAEKVIIAVLVIGVVAWLWLMLFFDPARARIDEAQRGLQTTEAQISGMETRARQARTQLQQDPEQALREQISDLMARQQEVDREIAELAGRLVPPNEMTSLLTTVLDEQSGLTLARVENRQPQPLRTVEASGEEGEQPIGQVWRHGLTLEFSGSFFNTLRYLEYLESLSARFFWDGLQFTVEDWPTARVTLQLHTLSSEEGFVGFGV